MTTLINEKLVNLNLKAGTPKDSIEDLAKLIHSDNRLNDFNGYYEAVLDRESEVSTAIGFGIAIPHGKTKHVKETTVAFGRSNKGVEWEGFDDEPVKIIILLAVPEEAKGDQHLQIIASISRKLIHKEFRELLMEADEAEIVSLISDTLTN